MSACAGKKDMCNGVVAALTMLKTWFKAFFNVCMWLRCREEGRLERRHRGGGGHHNAQDFYDAEDLVPLSRLHVAALQGRRTCGTAFLQGWRLAQPSGCASGGRPSAWPQPSRWPPRQRPWTPPGGTSSAACVPSYSLLPDWETANRGPSHYRN